MTGSCNQHVDCLVKKNYNMGNKATKAFNNIFPVVSRAVKNYNFTDRAERAITKDKRPTAPRHSSTVDILDKFSEGYKTQFCIQHI